MYWKYLSRRVILITTAVQMFWQTESGQTETSKKISDYSEHVYFSGYKYETALP